MALRLLLLDKSAYVKGVGGSASDELCLCAVTRLELLYSARSLTDYGRLEDDLDLFRDLRIDAQTLATALGAQRKLAATGRHRVTVPDLLIAACAQQHGAAVAHVDSHYDVLAAVLSFESVRA